MSASTETEYRSVMADVDMSNQGVNQYTFVSISESANGFVGWDQGGETCKPWATGTRAYGILLNAPKAGQGATIRVRGQEKIRCGAAWRVGDLLGEMAGGLCGPVASGATPRGQAVNSAVVGDVAMIELF